MDYAVLLICGGLAALGVIRGFVAEILSLAAWVAGALAVKVFYDPAAALIATRVTTPGGAAVLAYGLVFGITFLLAKLIASRVGAASRGSFIGPVDRVLGGGFGALKGLVIATMVFLAYTLVYDMLHGKSAERPAWMTASRTYPLIRASGDALVSFVERQRNR